MIGDKRLDDKGELTIRLELDTIAGLIMPMRHNKDRMVFAETT